ncbi:MAG: hypothetical protein QMD46_08920 [Methanomicrobiales archaeon]|nr:hypothetical protein [Methanomicrobiales archaeon]MDI6875489.1 hypothetical protein [Methanomicrobiales archaeon]
MVFWAERRDLSNREMDAIREWIRSGHGVNVYLRDPGQLPPEYRTGMRAYVRALDSAIYRSRLDRESVDRIRAVQGGRAPQVFRGMAGPDAGAVLERVRTGVERFRDAGYQPFTARRDVVTECIWSAAEPRVVFAVPCTVGETALYIGGSDHEVIFPRNTAWRVRSTEEIVLADGVATLVRMGREPAEGQGGERRTAGGGVRWAGVKG